MKGNKRGRPTANFLITLHMSFMSKGLNVFPDSYKFTVPRYPPYSMAALPPSINDAFENEKNETLAEHLFNSLCFQSIGMLKSASTMKKVTQSIAKRARNSSEESR